MNVFYHSLTIATVCFASALGLAAVLRKPRAMASWFFFAGILALAAESAFGHLTIEAATRDQADARLTASVIAKALLPGFWLAFSLVYCRGNARQFLAKWKIILAAAFVLPVGIAIVRRQQLVEIVFSDSGETWWIRFGPSAQLVFLLLLLAVIGVLVNLEKTFRAAAGTERWRIKHLVLGLALIFGTRIYTLSQRLLFSDFSLGMNTIETAALLLGCTLMLGAYIRKGFEQLDLYPSQAVLRGSLTIVLAGSYLIVLGVLAQVVSFLGGAASFPAQAFVILVGILALGVLLLSDRFRMRMRRLVARHFRRPQYNFREIWGQFTDRTTSVLDREGLCRVSAKLLSETFDIMTVSLFVLDAKKGQLIRSASTLERTAKLGEPVSEEPLNTEMIRALQDKVGIFDLDESGEDWAEALRKASPVQFQHGGHRFAVPLSTRGQLLGVAVLADRTSGSPYTQEELDLLGCVSDQLAAALLNRRLTHEVMQAKEVEALQAMSTFFVHDLKNAANSLTLMLQNLPEHFNDPAFREDALRGISKTVDRINYLIQRLGTFRGQLHIEPVESDLNALVEESLQHLNGAMEGVTVERELRPLPRIPLDREQMQGVLTNLLINAREALGENGRIRVETSEADGQVVLSVKDNGCGMTPDFMKASLFRPFRSTKSKGLGIGVFQSKLIVEAHHGKMEVESESGEGTTFQVSLPVETKRVS